MVIRKRFIRLAILSILGISFWVMGSVLQATAETLNFKFFNHVTKGEVLPIPDAEGHVVSLFAREGTVIFENGELAWHKATITNDLIKGVGTHDEYLVFTFLDGSIIVSRMKGPSEPVSPGAAARIKWEGDITHGTGRFQGIKGTITNFWKMLPPEKGEPMGKILVDGALVFTLPVK